MKRLISILFVSAISVSEVAAVDPIEASGVKGGFVVHIDCGNGAETIKLRKSDSFVVQGLETELSKVNEARKMLRGKGLYGDISTVEYDGKRLPYVDDLVSLVVLGGKQEVSEEIESVLAPRGVVVSSEGNVLYTKPVPPKIDDWTHYLYDSTGNPVSRDTRIGIPERIQWSASPWWGGDHDSDAGMTAMVSSKGRLFAIINETMFQVPNFQVPNKKFKDPWFLTARDAYNGVLLWRRPIKEWGWQAWKTKYVPVFAQTPLQAVRRLVAAGDRVYVTLGYNAPISELDAATGKTLRVFKGSAHTDEFLISGGKLIAAVNRKRFEPSAMADSDPPTQKTIKAYNIDTGEMLWESRVVQGSKNMLTPRYGGSFLNLVASSKAVCFIDRQDIVCLNADTGIERWRKAVVDKGEARTAALKIADNYCIWNNGRELSAFNLETGGEIWSGGHGNITWNTWRDSFVLDGIAWTWSPEVERTTLEELYPNETFAPKSLRRRSSFPVDLLGYDIKTGAVSKEIHLGPFYAATHHHRCFQNKATPNYIITGRHGMEFIDLNTGKLDLIAWSRGGCQYGILPANGMIYTPPHTCWCFASSSINGFNALAAKPEDRRSVYTKLSPRLTKGPANNTQVYRSAADTSGSARLPAVGSALSPQPSNSDWPTFRGNALRGAINEKGLATSKLKKAWSVKAGRNISAPISAGNSVFAADIDSHAVICLDAETGEKRWIFTAGARVDSPPTYYKGMLFFGSADGSVYALQAQTGELVWRFYSNYPVLMHTRDGQAESTAPVHGSVLIYNDKLYFAAGRNAYVDAGITIFVLDPVTGRILKKRTEQWEREERKSMLTEAAHAADGIKNDILSTDGERIYLHVNAFTMELEDRKEGDPKHRNKNPYPNNPIAFGGLLDNTITRRGSLFVSKRSAFGEMLCFDKEVSYSAKMVERLTWLRKATHFSPAQGGFYLYATKEGKREPLWEIRYPIVVRAMAGTSTHILFAGAPDKINPEDPLRNYESRGKGLLVAVNRATGKVEADYDLPAAVTFNGIAVTADSLILTLANGSVLRMVH